MSKPKDSYQSTLDYLYEQLPMYQRVGATAFKKDLNNIIALCQHLGMPQEQFPSIHIAGTNGKGSTTHLLGGVLQASGLKVGMYTSPHYKDFRERIKINGVFVSKAAVIAFVATNRAVFEKIQPSFFEITVALAFHYFAEQQVDVAIIETGLGGRLDSTNVIYPILSIITNISYDHQNLLGNTLKEIAFEKAGIIKEKRPVVLGEMQAATTPVFQEQAKIKKAVLYLAEQHFELQEVRKSSFHNYYHILRDKQLFIDNLSVNVKGAYQTKNIKTVLQAIEVINERALLPKISILHIREGLKNVKKMTYFIGRWQQLATHPCKIICDSGHNEAGIQAILANLEHLNYQKLHFVLGMVKDKDSGKILDLLPKDASYYFAKANIPRGLDAKQLKVEATKFGLKGRSYVSVKNALNAAKRKAKMEDLIFIGGSIFVVAEII